MIPKDRRFKTVNNLIAGGYITTFREIFDTLPRSVMAKHLGKNNIAFSKRIDNPDEFTLNEITRMAAILEVEERVMLDLVMKQRDRDSSKIV